MADDRVFSINDFKAGLDVRKTPLTAPGGSLRILENAVLNQGGEIEKRLAFVHMTDMPSSYKYLLGRSDGLYAFGVGTGDAPIAPGLLPVAIYPQNLEAPAGDTVYQIFDVEPFDDKFFVLGRSASRTYCWYNNLLVKEVDGSLSSGTYARVWKGKMYRLDGKYLRFSGVNNPAQNDPNSVTEPGAGFINLVLNDPEALKLLSLEVYYNSMAVMAQLVTQIWKLDPDLTKDTLDQVLRVGTVSPKSVVQFGTGDILFLSDSGVRSLKSSALTLAASITDIGSAIDLLLIPLIRDDLDGALLAEAVIQPIQGRYWLSFRETIFVLSYFPAGEITAWSLFRPGFETRQFAVVGNYVFACDVNASIFLYGGVTRAEYDSSKVTIRTPHMSADAPTQSKRIKSVDVMCTGEWAVSIGMLATDVDAFELCATVTNNTFGIARIPFAGYGSHISVHLEHEAPGPALLASIHLNLNEGAVG